MDNNNFSLLVTYLDSLVFWKVFGDLTSEILHNDPNFVLKFQKRIQALTTKRLVDENKQWLAKKVIKQRENDQKLILPYRGRHFDFSEHSLTACTVDSH